MSPVAASPLRIFIVEHDPETRGSFRMYLESLGHTVCEAATLAAALAEIPAAACQVLIADVGLTDGTGWELLRRLREGGVPHPCYAIAVSRFGMNADRVRSKRSGFRHHLHMPFDPESLERCLAEASRELAARS